MFELAAAHISAVVPRNCSRASTFTSFVDEELHDRHTSGPGRHHQGGLAMSQRCVGIGAGLQQQTHELIGIAGLAGQYQRRHSSRRCGTLGFACAFRSTAAGVASPWYAAQCRAVLPSGCGGVDVGLGGQQVFELPVILIHNGVGHIARGRGDAAQRTSQNEQRQLRLAADLAVGNPIDRCPPGPQQATHSTSITPGAS